jgi:hypothetical protein
MVYPPICRRDKSIYPPLGNRENKANKNELQEINGNRGVVKKFANQCLYGYGVKITKKRSHVMGKTN